MAQTDRQRDILTHGHGDSMTKLAQWGQFSENGLLLKGSSGEKTYKYENLCIFLLFSGMILLIMTRGQVLQYSSARTQSGRHRAQFLSLLTHFLSHLALFLS